jgi:hypothetical protein
MFLGKSFLPDEYLSLHYFGAKDFYIFQVVTYMFVHGSFMHLLGNMFGLYMFGSLLERIWGAQRFLFFYFFCGIGAGLLYVGIQHFVDFAEIRRATELVLSNPSSFNLMDYAQHYAVIGSPQGVALNTDSQIQKCSCSHFPFPSKLNILSASMDYTSSIKAYNNMKEIMWRISHILEG